MSAEDDVATVAQELLKRLDRPTCLFLEQARELARLTGSPAIDAGHLALALLGPADGRLDALLQRRFGGLRAATVAGSLRDILELAANGNGESAQVLPPKGSVALADLTGDARSRLQRASEASAASGSEQIGLQSLTRALLDQAPASLVEAFRDAGVNAAEVASLAQEVTVEGGAAVPGPIPIFQDGTIHLAALAPTVRGAVARMAQRAAPASDLTDSDLLGALLAEEGSRFAAALHVLGLSPAAIRRSLSRSTAAPSSAPGAVALAESQLSRLLRRVFQDAAALTAADGLALVSESHVVLAHLKRVGSSAGNLYQRLGIDAARLRALLERYPEDRQATPDEAPAAATAIDDLEDALRSAVINQDDAIARVLPALKRMRAGLAEPGRPLGLFLFLGPTGVGKTELARAVATQAFGATPGQRNSHLIKLDCGNFTERRDIVQLLGGPQGLMGYGEGQLTRGLRDKPRSVILFDEAEKANPEVWQSLLPLFDEGVVREANGTEHDATGCILVATSNPGYKEAIQKFNLWEKDFGAGALPREVQDFVSRQVEEYFSPEFRGRFGRENVILFRHFDRTSYGAIVRLQVRKFREEMDGRGLAVKVPEAVEDRLAKLAWQERQDGARQVARLVTRYLRNQITDAILADPRRTSFSFAAQEGRGEIRLLA